MRRQEPASKASSRDSELGAMALGEVGRGTRSAASFFELVEQRRWHVTHGAIPLVDGDLLLAVLAGNMSADVTSIFQMRSSVMSYSAIWNSIFS